MPDPMKQIDAADSLTGFMKMHGPLMSNASLAQALGLPSTSALRQARRRGLVGVRTFKIAGRRGIFALTEDVAQWLTIQSQTSRTCDGEEIAFSVQNKGGGNVEA
jgi:hypothetical protein